MNHSPISAHDEPNSRLQLLGQLKGLRSIVDSPFARSIDLAVWKETNRAPFQGVLVLLDAVSDAPPSGAHGHRVFMPSKVAERSVESLLGMGLSYDPALVRHNPRQKIGVIDWAEVVAKRIEFGGHIFASDFPEIISILVDPNSDLGVSYESRNCTVKNKSASIWRITDCVFTGAAILKRQSAAYRSTQIRLDFQA